jgi:hypothetical protein
VELETWGHDRVPDGVNLEALPHFSFSVKMRCLDVDGHGPDIFFFGEAPEPIGESVLRLAQESFVRAWKVCSDSLRTKLIGEVRSSFAPEQFDQLLARFLAGYVGELSVEEERFLVLHVDRPYSISDASFEYWLQALEVVHKFIPMTCVTVLL